MESREVIDGIDSIYDSFNVIGNLRLHMRTVAAVGYLVMDCWKETSVRLNRDDIAAALLLHDLGNIVKFNFNNRSLWKGLKDEEILQWQTVRDDVVARYGSADDHMVTNRMAGEINPGSRVLYLVSTMLMEKAEEIIDSSDFDLKVCAYADQRVAPWGIATLKERFSDLTVRYVTASPGYFEGRLQLAEHLESEVLANTVLRPEDINSGSVNRYIPPSV